MKFEYKNNMILLKDDDSNLVGTVTFKCDDKQCIITHTNVRSEYQGKGYASKLVEEAYKYIKSCNKEVAATCSYAKSWLEKRN